MTGEEMAYRAFAAAIVLQAVKDYRHEVFAAMHYNDKHAAARVKRLEMFFRSPWCFDLCDTDGLKIIKQLRKECHYDSKRIPDAGK
jgi:hypothetical protein